MKVFLIKENTAEKADNKMPVSNEKRKTSSKKLHSKQLLDVWSESCPVDQYSSKKVAKNRISKVNRFLLKNLKVFFTERKFGFFKDLKVLYVNLAFL